MGFAERVAEAVAIRGMNPYALEIAAGLGKGHGHRLINPRGETQRPGVQTVRLVSAALDAPFDWISDGVGDPPKPRPEPELPAERFERANDPATLNDRAWVAFHCLPKVKGRRPSRATLEHQYELPRDILSDLFNDARSSVPTGVVARLAEALGVSEDWLREGKGPGPKVSGPVPLRTTRYPLNAPHALLQLSPQLVGKTHDEFVDQAMLDRMQSLNNFEIATKKFARASDKLLRRAKPIARQRCNPRMSVAECEVELARALGHVWRADHEEQRGRRV